MRLLLLGLFVVLMADSMFGWGLGIGPGFSIKNALLYLILLLLVLEFAVTREKRIFELPGIHLSFVLLIALATFSWAANTFAGSYVDYQPVRGFIALKGYMLDHYLFLLVFFLGARSQVDVIFLQRWILAIIAIGSILTVMDGYNLPNLNVIEVRGDGRVTGPLGEANQYGLFVAMFLPMLVAKAWASKGFERVVFGVGALFTFWVLVLTVSRGAYFALFVGSFVAAIYLKPFLNARFVRLALAGVLVLVCATILLLGQEYADLIMERTVEAGSRGDAYEMSSGRTWIWASALGLMLDQPLSLITGYGWRTFTDAMGFAPHNTYFGRFFELGVLGLLLFVGLMVAVLRYAKQAIGSGSVERTNLLPALMGFVFGFCVLLVGLFFVDLFQAWYFVWAYCGLAMRGMAEALRQSGVSEATTAATNNGAPALAGVRIRNRRV